LPINGRVLGRAAVQWLTQNHKANPNCDPRAGSASILGLVVAFGGIIGGLVMEGGKISDITQVTAAIVVLGGTLGAVMVTSPLAALIARPRV